jgi:hypothetical protein
MGLGFRQQEFRLKASVEASPVGYRRVQAVSNGLHHLVRVLVAHEHKSAMSKLQPSVLRFSSSTSRLSSPETQRELDIPL